MPFFEPDMALLVLFYTCDTHKSSEMYCYYKLNFKFHAFRGITDRADSLDLSKQPDEVKAKTIVKVS